MFYKQDVANTVLDGIPEKERMYFVHSYTAKPSNDSFRLADTYYGGRQISAVIRKGKCYEHNFIRKKSGEMGLKIISNFFKIRIEWKKL